MILQNLAVHFHAIKLNAFLFIFIHYDIIMIATMFTALETRVPTIVVIMNFIKSGESGLAKTGPAMPPPMPINTIYCKFCRLQIFATCLVWRLFLCAWKEEMNLETRLRNGFNYMGIPKFGSCSSWPHSQVPSTWWRKAIYSLFVHVQIYVVLL